MKKLRKSEARGKAEHGWLHSLHTFSFADYKDPAHMGFRTLRVINEDKVEPGEGFATHSHRDMEILTYVLKGALEHKDSMGNTSVVRPGEIQRMSAGFGVTHSEYNHSKTEPVHLLQIWILTEKKGIEPSYEQKKFSEKARSNQLRLLVSRDGREGSVTIYQDVLVYDSLLKSQQQVLYEIDQNRHVWLQCTKGELIVDNEKLKEGDGLAVSDEAKLNIRAKQDASFLLFDLN